MVSTNLHLKVRPNRYCNIVLSVGLITGGSPIPETSDTTRYLRMERLGTGSGQRGRAELLGARRKLLGVAGSVFAPPVSKGRPASPSIGNGNAEAVYLVFGFCSLIYRGRRYA